MFAIMAGFGLLWMVIFGLWVWSLIHCITNKRLSDQNRLIGILLIVLLGPLGSLIYLAVPREPPPRPTGHRRRPGARSPGWER